MTPLDLADIRSALSRATGCGAVDLESYRQDVGALLDALEDARKERAAVVAWLREEEYPMLADALQRGYHREEEP